MAICVSLRLHFVATLQTENNTLTNFSFDTNSIAQINTFLVTLVRRFDFSLPENGQKIVPLKTGTITPHVVGEEHKGPQMPLKVTVLDDE